MTTKEKGSRRRDSDQGNTVHLTSMTWRQSQNDHSVFEYMSFVFVLIFASRARDSYIDLYAVFITIRTSRIVWSGSTSLDDIIYRSVRRARCHRIWLSLTVICTVIQVSSTTDNVDGQIFDEVSVKKNQCVTVITNSRQWSTGYSKYDLLKIFSDDNVISKV